MTLETEGQTLTPNIRSFLSTQVRHTTIATVNPDGTPHQIVIWYLLRGDEVVINSRQGRRWPSNLRREKRANLAVFDGDDAVTLDVDVVDSYEGDRAQADIAEMAHRYYSPEAAAIDIAKFQTQERVSFVLRPRRVHIHGDPQ